jgi:raffinose/stachyose/melibiose transport system substrate-binding protein
MEDIMKNMKKLFVLIPLIALAILGCSKSGGAKAADKGYDLYVFNTKGENAAQFTAMGEAFQKETGIRIKTFSIGAGQDSTAPLNTEMNSKNYPVIYCADYYGLESWIQGGFITNLNAVTGHPEFEKLAKSIDPTLYLTNGGNANYGIPFNVEGYGYIADEQMIGLIFGADKVDAVLADITSASYTEWEALVKALDSWI